MNKKYLLIIGLVMFQLSSYGLFQNNSNEISHWRGPNRDGKYPDTGLLKEWPEDGPVMAWKYEELGKGFSCPAFANDIVYITGTPDSITYIHAFNHEGELIWKKELGLEWLKNYPGARSTPKIINDKGYILSGLGILTCFDAIKGDKIWEINLFEKFDGQNIMFGITENLLIEGDILYCMPGGKESNIIALNRLTGELIWKNKSNGELSAHCAPVFFEHNGVKYIASYSSHAILAINAKNGDLAWSFPMNYEFGVHSNSPLYNDGCIFAMDGWKEGSFMLKISEDGKSVEEVWRNKLMDLENGDAILIGNNLYGANWEQKGFSCVDWKTGVEKFKNSELISGSILYAENLFYWYGINGKTALIKPTETALEIISQFQVPGSKRRDHCAHPVIHNKKLYLRHDKNLWVYNINEN